MRVNTLTLATASAAVLTIGLASPALASPTLGDHQGLRIQGANRQFLPDEAAQYQALLQRRGDDDGDDGDRDGDRDGRDGRDDDDCGDDGCADGDSVSRHRHCGSFSSCRGLFGGGGFGGGGFGDGGGGPSGTGVEYGVSGAAAKRPQRMERERVAERPEMARPGRPVMRRQVARVPRRAAAAGFGGSQGTNLPLGIAGLSLILGGAGLLPLARRRIRTSGRA
jgi:hypothetical protein